MSVSKNNPIITLFETVAYLHRKGYERLRIMASAAPSGMSLGYVSLLKRISTTRPVLSCANAIATKSIDTQPGRNSCSSMTMPGWRTHR